MKILQGLVLKHVYILLILNFPLNMEAAEKLGPISIPRGSLGGMFFKFIYTVVRM